MFRVGPLQYFFVFLLYERDETVINMATEDDIPW
jgi:hypothetical protein